MTAEFNEESTTKEAALKEREEKLDEVQKHNNEQAQSLASWAHRLSDRRRHLSVMQANLTKEFGNLKQTSAQLSSEKGRLVRKYSSLKSEKKRMLL